MSLFNENKDCVLAKGGSWSELYVLSVLESYGVPRSQGKALMYRIESEFFTRVKGLGGRAEWSIHHEEVEGDIQSIQLDFDELRDVVIIDAAREYYEELSD